MEEIVVGAMLIRDIRIIKQYLRGLKWDRYQISLVSRRFARNPDIAAEAADYLRTNCFPENAIIQAGYTAERLFKEYRHYFKSGLSAYSFLIFLREDREEAIDYLRRGCPIK